MKHQTPERRREMKAAIEAYKKANLSVRKAPRSVRQAAWVPVEIIDFFKVGREEWAKNKNGQVKEISDFRY